jgi:pimeloyl-ACP methyl ester carboxylesterase
MAHDPREDLRRIKVPVLALTGAKDLQVDPADLQVIAATVPGGATTQLLPDVSHTLRRQPGPASLGAYKKELRGPVNPDVLGSVVTWCREVTGLV